MTSDLGDWAGTYVIGYVLEDGSALIFNGQTDADGNNVAATVTDNKVTVSMDNAIVVEAVEGGYTLKAKGGYLNGKIAEEKPANGTTFETTPSTATIKWENGKPTITSAAGTVMRYNGGLQYGSETEYYHWFRFYKATSSVQTPVVLFKLVEGGDTPTPPTPPTPPEPTPDPKPGNEYVLTNELKDGDEVVIYNPGYGKAIKNENDNNWYLVAQEVTPADNKITTDDTTIVWTVKKNEDGTFSFVNGDNAITAWLSGTYIELTNDASYSGGDTKWNVATGTAENNTFYISSKTIAGSYGPGYLECYPKTNKTTGETVDKICGYSTNNPKEKDCGFQFFVKGGTTPTPDPDPDPDPAGEATIIFAPSDVWEDGTGYQLLLDKDANTYGTLFDVENGFVNADETTGVVPAADYAQFEYKLPENADGDPETENFLVGATKTVKVPAGTYDIAVTNPSPASQYELDGTTYEDPAWIYFAGSGTLDNYTFEAGKTYTISVIVNPDYDETSDTSTYDLVKITTDGTTPDPDPDPKPDPDPEPTDGKYVPATEFKAGDKIVIVATQDGKLYAMSNAIENSVAPAIEVTATDGALNSVTDSIVWTLGTAEGGFTLNANGSQLQIDKGNVSLVAEGGTFAVTGTGVSCTETSNRSLFTQLYNGSYRFKNYANSNIGSSNYATAVTVYKYVAK